MIRNLFYFTIAVVFLASCNKDFLNINPTSEVPSELTWTDAPLAEAYVTGCYRGLGSGGFDEQMLASLSDEALFTHAGRGINTVNEGTLNPANRGWSNGSYDWAAMYNIIRAVNVALDKLPTASFDNRDMNDRLRGEAHFLKAYYHNQLLRTYGGIPIVEKLYGLNEGDYTMPRNTYAECVDFVVKECDSAIALLDGRTMAKGRTNKIAAMALKARVLLYAASDLHDIPTAETKSTVLSGFSKKELLGYTSGDRIERWQKAKDAAWATILEMGGEAGGYKMNLTAPVSADEAKANYMSIAMGGGSTAQGIDAAAGREVIWGRYFAAGNADSDNWSAVRTGLNNGPNGYHNWAGNAPIGELVDDYEMMDGTKFNWSTPAHKADPYINREPRFYASILYDGADWKPRNLISGNVDPANQIQTGQYTTAPGTIIFGLDTRQGPIENWNGSWTGYYMRKFIDPNPEIVENTGRQFIPWPFFRYTEMVFNYIEASLELGQDAEAKKWLDRIRFRAGMPAVTESGAALKDRYRHERRLEMVYEEQRYYDARRWMIAPTTLGRKIHYASVQGALKSGQTAPSPYKKDATKFTYTYNSVENNSLENRNWLDKMYFRPISRDEMNKNDKLVQNPGYE